MKFMTIFVRVCAFYNFGGVLSFLVPGVLPLLGVRLPHSPFWVWLPALMGFFAGMVLLLSARDLTRYASFPYWNGIVRLIFITVTFLFNFGESAGGFITILALGDIPLAIVCIFGVPRVLNKSHVDLLLGR